MKRWPILGALALLAVAVLGAPARATHAPDHRFILIGFVTDGQGRPLSNVPIVVTRLKTGLDYPTRTERDGLYLVVVHLHDEDEGERLGIQVSGMSGEVQARFDVRDKKVERGTRVDVRDRTLVENRQAFAETLRAYLAR